MNTIELKQAIEDDLITLKSLDVDIIPAREYYGGLLKLFAGVLWKLSLIVFFAILYASYSEPSNSGIANESLMRLITESAFMALFMSLGALIVLGSALIHYYLIQYYLKNKLKTGQLLVNKLKHCGWVFLGVFAFFSLGFASFTQSAAIFLMIGFSFFIGVFLSQMFLNMEMNRVGISTIYTVVNQWFKKDKVD